MLQIPLDIILIATISFVLADSKPIKTDGDKCMHMCKPNGNGTRVSKDFVYSDISIKGRVKIDGKRKETNYKVSSACFYYRIPLTPYYR